MREAGAEKHGGERSSVDGPRVHAKLSVCRSRKDVSFVFTRSARVENGRRDSAGEKVRNRDGGEPARIA